MAVKIALESFVAVLRRSNLVAPDRLLPLLEAYQRQSATANDARRLAEFLVAQKALTPWQAEKLLQGKHKGFFLGNYRLLALVGKGGMSSVYLAEHQVMRRRCAIKVLPTRRLQNASSLARFHREAQAVAALDQAYRDYYAAVGDHNRAQFRLYRALGHPAECLANANNASPTPSSNGGGKQGTTPALPAGEGAGGRGLPPNPPVRPASYLQRGFPAPVSVHAKPE